MHRSSIKGRTDSKDLASSNPSAVFFQGAKEERVREPTLEGSQKLPEFSLLGGPLHRLGLRLGLVRGKTKTIPLGVALGVLLWIVTVGLTVLEGFSDQLFSLAKIAGHVRLLAAIGTSDLQSLADLANGVNIVRNMRTVPFGPRLLVSLTLAAFVPLLPLLLFKYPLADLSERVVRMVLGL